MPEPKPAKPPLKRRLTKLFEEYGSVAIGVYLVLSLLTIIGFSVAIGLGVEPSDASGVIGVIIAGWLAAKITLPIRIPIAIVLTPVVARVLRGRRAARGEDVDADDDGDDDDGEYEDDEDEDDDDDHEDAGVKATGRARR